MENVSICQPNKSGSRKLDGLGIEGLMFPYVRNFQSMTIPYVHTYIVNNSSALYFLRSHLPKDFDLENIVLITINFIRYNGEGIDPQQIQTTWETGRETV